MEKPRVFDMQGNEKDMMWVRQVYGSDLARATTEMLSGATHVYRLIEFREREGPSNIDTFIRGEDGQPQASVTVAFYWPDAPTLSRPGEWKPRKYYQRTDTSGKVGFALGPGAYIHDPAVGGPHAIWVSEPTVPSDLGDKLGMLAGTNHRHLEPIFQLQPLGVISLTIDSPSDGAVLSATEVTVTGMTEPGFTVGLTIDGTQVPSVIAGGDGTYNFAKVPLQEGVNMLSAQATSPLGDLTSGIVAITVHVSLAGEEWERKYRELQAEFEQFKRDLRLLNSECEDIMKRAQAELTHAQAKADDIKRLLQ